MASFVSPQQVLAIRQKNNGSFASVYIEPKTNTHEYPDHSLQVDCNAVVNYILSCSQKKVLSFG